MLMCFLHVNLEASQMYHNRSLEVVASGVWLNNS
jgi:hypothetical protein